MNKIKQCFIVIHSLYCFQTFTSIMINVVPNMIVIKLYLLTYVKSQIHLILLKITAYLSVFEHKYQHYFAINVYSK